MYGHQEPGSDEDIAQFCSLHFGVHSHYLRKQMYGPDANPLFEELKSKPPVFLAQTYKMELH